MGALPTSDLCSNETTSMFRDFDFSNYSYPQKNEPLNFSAAELVKMDDLTDMDDFVQGVNNKAARSDRHVLLCPSCGFEASSEHYLKLHKEQHHTKEHKCQLCSFSSSLQRLKEHVIADHKSSNLACDKCSHVALTSKQLSTHQRSTHDSGSLKSFLCRPEVSEGGCEASFGDREGLVGALSRGNAGREHLPQEPSDHTY